MVVAPGRRAARPSGASQVRPRRYPAAARRASRRGPPEPGLAEDVAAVRHVLTASDEPTVVVAHSYGGIVTAEAATGVEAVRHLLLVSSYLPEAGQSLSSFGRGSPPRSSTSIPRAGRSPSERKHWRRRSSRTATRRFSERRARRRPARALQVLEQPAQSAAWQKRGVDLPRLRRGPGHPRRACSAGSRAGRAASWNSMPATIRSYPNLPPYATWSSRYELRPDGRGLTGPRRPTRTRRRRGTAFRSRPVQRIMP